MRGKPINRKRPMIETDFVDEAHVRDFFERLGKDYFEKSETDVLIDFAKEEGIRWSEFGKNLYLLSSGVFAQVESRVTLGIEQFVVAQINPGPTTNRGYLRLIVEGKAKYIHRLVAETFVKNPEHLEIVHHIDGNKKNNRAENLRWISKIESNKLTVDGGAMVKARGEAHGKNIYGIEAMRIVKANPTMPAKKLAALVGVSVHAIYAFRNGRTWQWL